MIPVAVVGAGGYTGVELVSILARHPVLEAVALFGSSSRDGARPMAEIEPALRGVVDLAVEASSVGAVIASGARLVFLATPHEVSAELAGPLVGAGMTVVDLSGAFRLKDEAAHREHYGFAREAALVAEAVYGLPEVSREGLAGARLIACAGCYVTAATVPLAALVRAGVVERGSRPIVDAVSGVSGAGRHAAMHLSEVSARPYGVGSHRHRPEIEAYAGTRVVFQPHLGPFDRGILATIHVRTPGGTTVERVRQAFARVTGEAFVRVLPAGEWPSVRAVARTNYLDLAWSLDEGERHLVVFGALDNLVKGASGQAVQCANLALGLDEGAGLAAMRSGVTA